MKEANPVGRKNIEKTLLSDFLPLIPFDFLSFCGTKTDTGRPLLEIPIASLVVFIHMEKRHSVRNVC